MHGFRSSRDERLEWVPVQTRLSAAAIKSGLRRTSAFCFKRSRVDEADTVKKDWLDIEG
jgi:hypothetical protein